VRVERNCAWLSNRIRGRSDPVWVAKLAGAAHLELDGVPTFDGAGDCIAMRKGDNLRDPSLLLFEFLNGRFRGFYVHVYHGLRSSSTLTDSSPEMAEKGRTVTVQIGQCGNQLGSDFFSALADGAVSDAAVELPAFFRPGKYDTSAAVPRAVLIDAEPRVVTEVSRRNRVAPPAWRYDPVQPALKAVWESGAASGSANNWAMGYNVQSEVLAECVREGVRREAEHADAMQVSAPWTFSSASSKSPKILTPRLPT
jgi:hypothetical protein